MKRKIAYCIPSLHIPGGVERVISSKANYFAEVAGYEVYIILTDAKDKKNFFPLSEKIHLIQLDEDFEELWNQPLWKKLLIYQKRMRRYKKKLTRCLMDIRPDITISALRREINFLCDIQDGSKKIGEIHVHREQFRNLNEHKAPQFIKNFLLKIWNRQLIRSLKKLDAFVTLTPQDESNWPELMNVRSIANPLSFYSGTPSDGTQKRVIAVGRFCYTKGFDLLLQAWSGIVQKHPDWILDIYGDDGEKIQEYVKSQKIENSCILHPVTAHIENQFIEHSIFILSSRFEGFGMVIAEAMACGLPAVAFDCNYGPRNIIRNGEDGLLAKNGDIQDLADKVCSLIENEELRIRMGRNAYKNILRYHICNIGKQWTDLFDALLINS